MIKGYCSFDVLGIIASNVSPTNRDIVAFCSKSMLPVMEKSIACRPQKIISDDTVVTDRLVFGDFPVKDRWRVPPLFAIEKELKYCVFKRNSSHVMLKAVAMSAIHGKDPYGERAGGLSEIYRRCKRQIAVLRCKRDRLSDPIYKCSKKIKTEKRLRF